MAAHISTRPAAGEAGGVLEVRGYVRVRGIWRSRATRRRSRRAANFSTARRAAQTTRPIMISLPGARSVPAAHSFVQLDLAARAVFPLSPGLPTMGATMTFLGRGKS